MIMGSWRVENPVMNDGLMVPESNHNPSLNTSYSSHCYEKSTTIARSDNLHMEMNRRDYSMDCDELTPSLTCYVVPRFLKFSRGRFSFKSKSSNDDANSHCEEYNHPHDLQDDDVHNNNKKSFVSGHKFKKLRPWKKSKSSNKQVCVIIGLQWDV